MKTLRRFLSLVPIFLGSLTLSAETVRLAGSDLLGRAVLRPQLEAEAEHRGWDLAIAFDGSLNGTEAFRDGAADIAIVAHPGSETPEAPIALPLAFEVVGIIVHASNPVQDISLPLATAVFGRGAEDISRWGLLGASASWSDRPVSRHVLRSQDFLTLELFRNQALGARPLVESVNFWEDVGAMLRQVAGDPSVIVLAPAVDPLPADLRFLFVAADPAAQSYRPTPETVLYGDYPLRLPYYLLLRANAAPAVREVARFLLDQSVADALRQAHYLPLPESERRQFQLRIELGN